MPLLSLTANDFRCLQAVEFSPHPEFTLVTGANASGKTSLLEAIAYLGLGRSFRGAATRDLVRHGTDSFLLHGRVGRGDRTVRLGVRNGREGLEQSIDGERSGGTAALAEKLPLQVIDPEVHELVGGAPERRRRFIDWLTFHVEHRYAGLWRQFRRALKQRNALLRSGGRSLDSWDKEYCALATAVTEARRSVLAGAIPVLELAAGELLLAGVGLDFHRGWASDRDLADVLRESRARDLQVGTTHAGPHRADLKLRVEERMAKKLVSRGQQKLFACALIIGGLRVAGRALGETPLLLLDDPAAELDHQSLGRLMAAVGSLETQVIATALTAEALPVPASRAMFHVEQGVLAATNRPPR